MLTKLFWASVGIFTPIIVMTIAALFWSWFSEQRELIRKAWGKK